MSFVVCRAEFGRSDVPPCTGTICGSRRHGGGHGSHHHVPRFISTAAHTSGSPGSWLRFHMQMHIVHSAGAASWSCESHRINLAAFSVEWPGFTCGVAIDGVHASQYHVQKTDHDATSGGPYVWCKCGRVHKLAHALCVCVVGKSNGLLVLALQFNSCAIISSAQPTPN